ncbi:LamG-like jellyroll fold domain-containing protein [Portibacter marinus]|uniref:LamG-like jellyroll fold domain-containing protein n=1 Tax=Portibacter marinus TaxID=2898660 RepID=UPI001F2983A2|nr:LamG-like jellyroll fold domain-containing protein [Portibacter marinus]
MKTRNYSAILIGILFLQCRIVLAQIHSPSSAHPTYTGLVMTGYQGWFGTPGDGGTNGFRHYRDGGGFQPGNASIEYWPDMREAEPDEKYPTDFEFADGTTATVFSSVHPKTVNRHFQWMKEYGIDGAFMQRFRSDFGIKPTLNKVLQNGLDAARNNDRAIALMYDLSGTSIKSNGTVNPDKRAEEVARITDDFKALVDEMNLTTGGEDQPYLYHNGKPLVVLWGLGFNSRHDADGYDVQYFVDMVDFFQNDPVYGGCAIMIGVPTNWRQGGGDCISGFEHDKMIELLKSIDIIQPWHTSRYGRDQMATDFKSKVRSDVLWCNENDIDYTPTISPGIREKILHGNNYERPREGGYYFWDMARAAIDVGVEMLYLGMFDEVDEGTQYHKINNNPPFFSNTVSFADYGDDPEDHYLWLAGEAKRALTGEFVMGTTIRERAKSEAFETMVEFVDHGDVYSIFISEGAEGRAIYFADPYKVPDGAPTVGTQRDSSLFHNELLLDTITFSESDRGKFIRMVEVDELTGEVLAYKALVGVHGFSQVPYTTGFETGQVDERFWTTNSDSGNGRIYVTNELDAGNGFALFMDSDTEGSNSINVADLHVDLNGIQRDLILSMTVTIPSEIGANDGIYLSQDGGNTFTLAEEFSITGEGSSTISINLADRSEELELGFTTSYVIRLQHTASGPFTENKGIAIDDISIDFSSMPSGFAKFIGSDTETQGKWNGVYGVQGYYIAGIGENLPENVHLDLPQMQQTIIWEHNSSDERGLYYNMDSTILAADFVDSTEEPWSINLNLGEQEYNVSLYFLDGDDQGRIITVSLVDKATGETYNVQTVSDFSGGKWLTWKMNGKVRIELNTIEGPNAVFSGLFLSPSSPSEIVVEQFLTFDGTDDFVDCGRGEELLVSGNAITLEAWFNINESRAETFQSTILAMDHSEAGNDIGFFLRANGDGQINWGFGDGMWHEVSSGSEEKLFEEGTWNHVAGTYDGETQKIYLNGNLIFSSDTFSALVLPTLDENLYIGSSPAFPDRVVNGAVAEVRIWKVARTDSEIKEFSTKRLTGDEEGIAAYWPINEGSGQIINDLAGGGNTGILGGTVEETDKDPIWEEGDVVVFENAIEGFNPSFEDDLEFWRFFEVPNGLGSTVEIIQGDVVDGAKAAKVTFVAPEEGLADRAFDNWDSNMTLKPETIYQGSFWAKKQGESNGAINFTYGFFDENRNVLDESGITFDLTENYEKYEFTFSTPPGTAKGWISFRWRDKETNEFADGTIFIDHIEILTEVKDTSDADVKDAISGFNPSFEQDLEFWRFYEVPDALGSMVEIITDDVIDGEKAAKITFVEPVEGLADRAFDNWDSNMLLEPEKEYEGSFWAKEIGESDGSLIFSYGFFDDDRNVISEGNEIFDLSSTYDKYEFSYETPPGTAKGWISFRWKNKDTGAFSAGTIIVDHIQLLTEVEDTVVVTDTEDAIAGFNPSFEQDLEFWRFYEVPDVLGSMVEIITDDVIDGEKAAKVTFVEPVEGLADRAFDNWDSNMELKPEKEYNGSFWAKEVGESGGSLTFAYGFFDEDRNVISEGSEIYDLTNNYQEYKFTYNTPVGTAKGWISFRWKNKDTGAFSAGTIIVDHIQLLTEVEDTVVVTDTEDAIAGFNPSFEQDLEFWRFYEVPDALGSMVEIITDDVIDGEKAAKVTFMEPAEGLADRAFDNWDSNMELKPEKEYNGSFWAKEVGESGGSLTFAYGFFDEDRNVISEGSEVYDLTNNYQEYKFTYNTPVGTAKGWISFRWKNKDTGAFSAGTIIVDHIQLLTEVEDTVVVTDTEDAIAGFNPSFEQDLEFWRFYEVPDALGSMVEIITDDVIDGEKAAKVTFVEPVEGLADRAFDNWDSNMELKPEKEYNGSFWAKEVGESGGSLTFAYGFFDEDRNVISEGSEIYDLTNNYQEYKFTYNTPVGTAKGWISFRWKNKDTGAFSAGTIIVDHIQLITELDSTVNVDDIEIVQNELLPQFEIIPNPIYSEANLNIDLPESGWVDIRLFDLSGNQVDKIFSRSMNAGEHQVRVRFEHLPQGIYFIGLQSNQNMMTKKIILLGNE